MADSNDIDKAKKKAIDALKSHIDSMGNIAYEILLREIENTFTIQAGKIIPVKDFIKQLNRLTIKTLDLLQTEPKFTGPVSQFVKRMPAISDAITDFQKTTNNIKVPDFEIAKKVVIDEVIDKMLNNGLNQTFVQPLRDLIYRNATGGLSLKEARVQVKQMSSENGRLGKYIDQTAQQATDAYAGAINTKLLETFDYDGLLMTGSLIDNSSPQCRYVIEELGGKLSREDWPKVKEIAEKNGLIKGTTFDNLPINLMHFGCKHAFYPVILKKTA